MRNGLIALFVICGTVVVASLIFWAWYKPMSTDEILKKLAYQLSAFDATDCGSNLDYKQFSYPSKADECAAEAFRANKPFRVHGCYPRTDTSGCYWMVTTSNNQIYFIYYTSFALGNSVEDIRIAPCDKPEIVINHEVETLQCPSMPLDKFHIDW